MALLLPALRELEECCLKCCCWWRSSSSSTHTHPGPPEKRKHIQLWIVFLPAFLIVWSLSVWFRRAFSCGILVPTPPPYVPFSFNYMWVSLTTSTIHFTTALSHADRSTEKCRQHITAFAAHTHTYTGGSLSAKILMMYLSIKIKAPDYIILKWFVSMRGAS